MAISDINEDHPNPGATQHFFPTCVNCLHFARVPAFRVNGAPATCRSALIDRDPKAHPCKVFTFDTQAFLDLPEELKERLFDLIDDIEETNRSGHLALVGALIEAHKIARRKFRLGGRYWFESAGERLVGRLISLSRTQAIIRCGTANYTVPVDQIELVKNHVKKRLAAKIEV